MTGANDGRWLSMRVVVEMLIWQSHKSSNLTKLKLQGVYELSCVMQRCVD